MEKSERQKHLQRITQKLTWLTAISLFLLVITFYVILPIFKPDRTFLVTYVFMAGLIGGFVSIQQRLPGIGLDELSELSNSWLSILLIPVNGGIFAIVLMLMFLSEILKGPLFPTFMHYNIEHVNLVESFGGWLTKTFPASGQDIAKLLFWSFVAGFCERLVPQIIHKTAVNTEKKESL